jgi:predicted nucleotide-binding protein with TIR-like domain
MKPRVFIASSVEGLSVAYAVQECLEYDLEITVWPQGVFELSKSTLEGLYDQANRFDAAIFVFSPDDAVVVRGIGKQTVRDNVLFELGLFMGRLSRDKCFIIKPRSFSDTHFPTDLLGVTPGDYDDSRTDGNLVAAVGPACNKLRRALISASATGIGQGAPESHTGLEAILLAEPFRLVFNPPKFSKRIVFAADGKIIEGNNGNEHSWRIVQNKLELVQLDGKVHSRFVYDAADRTFKHTNDPDTLSIRNQFIVPER